MKVCSRDSPSILLSCFQAFCHLRQEEEAGRAERNWVSRCVSSEAFPAPLSSHVAEGGNCWKPLQAAGILQSARQPLGGHTQSWVMFTRVSPAVPEPTVAPVREGMGRLKSDLRLLLSSVVARPGAHLFQGHDHVQFQPSFSFGATTTFLNFSLPVACAASRFSRV